MMWKIFVKKKKKNGEVDINLLMKTGRSNFAAHFHGKKKKIKISKEAFWKYRNSKNEFVVLQCNVQQELVRLG